MDPGSAVAQAIARKRQGASLAEAWPDLVAWYLGGAIDDVEMGELLQACVQRGLEPEETHALTAAYVASGESLSHPDPRTVDKHSTGGVGDTCSLIVVPWVAACGVPVAKLSGRALRHTGGTLDKLESVAGVRTELSPEEFAACVAAVGCAIAAQSARLVPADRQTYALRDRTATVAEPGLIAASVVCKKVAGGAHGIAYDVKSGSGALLPDHAAARRLAQSLVDLTAAFGRRAVALVTDMHEPLGPSIGTGLEMAEARDFLQGTRRDPRLEAVARALALRMLRLARFEGDAHRALDNALDRGHAYERLEALLARLGARSGALGELRPHARAGTARAARSGYVAAVDPVKLGSLARELTAHHGERAGVVVTARVGDQVRAGATLAGVYGDAAFAAGVASAFALGDEPPPRETIYEEIEAASVSRSTAADEAGRSTLETR